MNRRQVLTLGGAALACPALARAASETTLRFVPYADLALLDPIITTNYVTRTHALLVFDTLYGTDAQFRPQPQMVAGHEVEADGRLWRLTLREGLRFHDGSPVLARDAVASLRRWAVRDAFGGALFAALDEISAPSDRVVQFRMRRPFPLLPQALAKPTSYVPVIMPERLAATPATSAVPEMVGSGPYRFVAQERVPGALAVYRRFAEYRPREGGEASFTAGPRIAHFERVEWRTMPDPATAASALRAGEVDWIEQPAIDLVPQLARARGVTVAVVEPAGLIGQIRFNHLQPPFDNPAICRAFLGAVDQTEMMDAVAGTDPAILRGPAGIFTPGGPMASEAGMEILTGPRDIARSRRELEAAGYRGEPVVLLAGTDVPRINAVCEVMAEVCRRLGVALDYVATDWGTVNQRILNPKPLDQGGWSLFGIFSGGLDHLSPAYHLATRGIGRAGVPSWLTDAPLEELRDAWFAAPDLAAQQAIAAKIQARALAVGAYIPCGRYVQPTAYRSELTGMLTGLPLFTNLRRGG
ncbi:extracellular solute-binding protein family 5 [Methylobacterium sp. 4-46]|uniref:ABC transporter substrate-binding protein n=1 Tax=unclassified Methylobacterium TaxID=2615210 RepID=UPI000152DDDA|nr:MULTISPECIES: ABC transporter substrate-binding protein [Methylobacterium]ACA18288.1 extracellular solute-binding protein family 5 [Methylobacterium sp. 4-46]WFT77587.1 ABC transporter substrate-binding protein [Methylobacterium nodulans]